MTKHFPCYLCGADTGGRLGPCEVCLKKRSELRSGGIDTSLRSARRTSALWWLDRNILTSLLFVILFVSWFFMQGTPKELPNIELIDSAGVPRTLCDEQRRCLVAYLTPWCPACRSTIKGLTELASYLEQEHYMQFQLVIGNSDPQTLRQFGRASPLAALYDDEDKVPRELGSGSVPRFYVVSSDGEIIKTVSGFISGGNAESRKGWYSKSFVAGN